jgi:DNA gyrase subunit A
MQRPDLIAVDPAVRRYIEYLEKRLNVTSGENADLSVPSSEPIFTESETTNCVITLSDHALVKRTYRHLYSRQHRGGMGVFDLDINAPDFLSLLASAEETQKLLLFTNRARAYRFSLNSLEALPVRARGIQPFDRLGFESGEQIVAILPEQARGYVALVSSTGKVRSLRHHLFGEHMRQGTSLFNLNEFGPLAAACWTPGDADLFIATQSGIGIRFNEKVLPPQGGIGIRAAEKDPVVAITSVDDQSSVFLIGSDGKGTIRMMSGFAVNKTPGGSGKIAFKNERVIGACSVNFEDDIFILTRLGKIIRFKADEVPATEGVVQGVNCVLLRADEVTAMMRTSLLTE